jgi:nitroreductase
MTDQMDFNGLTNILNARHSCRAFLPGEVPREQIAEIITAAQKVASWCNAQPWHLTITSGMSTDRFRAAMAKAVETAGHNADLPFPDRYDGAYRDRRRTCGWQLYEAVGIEKGDRAGSAAQMRENYRFFGAPHVAIVTTPKDLGPYGAVDCGAFVTGFMLAATAKGVATIAQAAIAGYSAEVRAHLDLADDRNIVCAISFGYEDRIDPANNFRTERAPLAEVVDWV